jgi:hypothetical protein
LKAYNDRNSVRKVEDKSSLPTVVLLGGHVLQIKGFFGVWPMNADTTNSAVYFITPAVAIASSNLD